MYRRSTFEVAKPLTRKYKAQPTETKTPNFYNCKKNVKRMKEK